MSVSSFIIRFSPALIIIIWAFIYLPDLHSGPFVHEEGRRAILVQDIAASGNIFIQHVYSEVYLNKPPGYPWLVWLVSQTTGSVNELAVRLPSALAMLGTALLVFFAGLENCPPVRRFLASLLVLVLPLCIEKGVLGETDAVFMFFIWAALLGIWQAINLQKLRWWVSAGILVGAAFLVKGPPVLVFILSALLGYTILSKDFRCMRAKYQFVLWFCMIAVISIWLIPLLFYLDSNTLLQTGSREMLERGESTLVGYLSERLTFVTGIAAGFFPASLAVFGLLISRKIDNTDYSSWRLFLVACVTGSLIVLFFYPGVRSRYGLPLAPVLVSLTAMSWPAAGKAHISTLRKVIEWIVWSVIIAVGLLLALNGLNTLLFEPDWQWMLFGLIAGGAAIIMLAQPALKTKPSGYAIQFIILIMLARILAHEQGLDRLESLHKKTVAQSVEATITPTQPVFLLDNACFNIFAYVDRNEIFVEDMQRIHSQTDPYWLASFSDNQALRLHEWKLHEYRIFHLGDRNTLLLLNISKPE